MKRLIIFFVFSAAMAMGQLVDPYARRELFKTSSFASIRGNQRTEAIRQIQGVYLFVQDVGLIAFQTPYQLDNCKYPIEWRNNHNDALTSNDLISVRYKVLPGFNGTMIEGDWNSPDYKVVFPSSIVETAIAGTVIEGVAGLKEIVAAKTYNGKEYKIRQYRYLFTNSPSISQINAHLDSGKTLEVFLDEQVKCQACKRFKSASQLKKPKSSVCEECSGSGSLMMRYRVTLTK